MRVVAPESGPFDGQSPPRGGMKEQVGMGGLVPGVVALEPVGHSAEPEVLGTELRDKGAESRWQGAGVGRGRADVHRGQDRPHRHAGRGDDVRRGHVDRRRGVQLGAVRHDRLRRRNQVVDRWRGHQGHRGQRQQADQESVFLHGESPLISSGPLVRKTEVSENRRYYLIGDSFPRGIGYSNIAVRLG